MSFWDDEARDAELKRLCADGYSAAEIATLLGAVSGNAIIGRCRRRGYQLKGFGSAERRGVARVEKKGRSTNSRPVRNAPPMVRMSRQPRPPKPPKPVAVRKPSAVKPGTGYVPRPRRMADVWESMAAKSAIVRQCSCPGCAATADRGSMWCAEHKEWAASVRASA